MSTSAAVVLSRQSLRPNRRTPWVHQTVAAVRWLHDENCELISSIGLSTWNLLTALASLDTVPLRLFLPVSEPESFDDHTKRIAAEFDLHPDRTVFIPVTSDSRRRNKSLLMLRRDRAIVHYADLVVPITVRPAGNMADLLDLARLSGKVVVDRFAVDYAHKPVGYCTTSYRNAVRAAADSEAAEYIIHWTRGTSHKWPDERELDFWSDILTSDIWPRDAEATLQRLLRRRHIVASPRHMPGKTACVCLSELCPSSLLPLMRWRARYREMSFEPYGVGFHRDLAPSLGLQPVTYFDPGENTPPEPERWHYQSRGTVTDWRAEREWRHRGDIDFDEIPTDAIRVFCPTRAEAARLSERLPYRIVSLFKE